MLLRVHSARRRALPLVSLLSVASVAPLACAACSGGGPAGVAVPSPSGEAAAACRDLASALPRRVQDQERGTPGQETPYAAVWGDPPIVLRCGVDRPAVLTPGSSTYNPAADAVEVNGVAWLVEEQPDGFRFTTTERSVYVEVTVPDDYAPEVNPLVDLAAPVDAHIPPDALRSAP